MYARRWRVVEHRYYILVVSIDTVLSIPVVQQWQWTGTEDSGWYLEYEVCLK